MNLGHEPYAVLRVVEAALRKHNVAPSRFGRDAVCDPRLIFDMRNGCTIKPRKIERIQAHLQKLEG